MAVSEHEFLYRNQHNCVILTPAESKRHVLEHHHHDRARAGLDRAPDDVAATRHSILTGWIARMPACRG
jgi:hypothetical protein